MRAHRLLLGLAALTSLGCGDPHEPPLDNLRVAVTTVGVDQDGIYVVRAGGPPQGIRTFLFLFLPPGEHYVVLEEIAANCSLEGPDSVRVTISPGQVAEATFEVACRAVTGAIEVSVPTSGRDFDPDGYTLHVDDLPAGRVYSGSSVVVEGLSPGRHVVSLGDFSPNCQVSGTLSRTAMVLVGGLTRDTVRIRFQGSCEATSGDVQILTTTRGADRDRNGYTVTADGELVIQECGFYDYYCVPDAPFLLVPNGSYLFPAVPIGEHTYRLGDIAPNCTAADGDSRTVAVAPGETSVVLFDVTCEGS